MPLQPNGDTPSGCRSDKGRCFKRGGWDAGSGLGIVQFRDESIYAFGPIDETDWQTEFSDREDPGCVWNYTWKDNHPTKWLKLQEFPEGLSHQF